ncbi:MAG: histidinol dehydrogenase [Clostridia bacterium]|jgi:histidinol dehydrogenase
MIRKINLSSENQNEFVNKFLRNRSEEDDSVSMVVENILKEVEENKDKAVFEYAKKFDGVTLNSSNVKVTKDEIDEAYKLVDKSLLDVIRKAKVNIENFQKKQVEESWYTEEKNGVILGQIVRPLEIAGVYVPGGTAVYPSSVLMNIIPAKVAGVERIIMVTPPKKDGINPAVVVAANEAGVDEIYKIGGAYAIAALAYGTETIPKVDKIVGPGNIYVATAKKLVFGVCDIDAIAGPSEIMIIADKTANADYIAADLLSQAEHDILASAILVTDSEELAGAVVSEIEVQMNNLSRKSIAEKAIEDLGMIVMVDSIDEAVGLANLFAPEHLELAVEKPEEILNCIKNAGAIFMGQYSPEPLGDYFAGPNHVLPTGGTARFFSALGVNDFIKKTSIISYTKEALDDVKDDVITFANAEGLTAHANAVKIRFLEENKEK